jgi:hypothetical protein
MAIGQQTSTGNINQMLTQLAIQWRDLSNQTLQQWAFLNKLGQDGLETLTFTSDDATAVLTAIDQMVQPAQVYKGTVQSGGTGGTGAILFNFEDAQTPLWAGG